MLNTPFNPWPSYSIEEANLISETLLSNKVNYWTGEQCKLFESEFAEWVGTNYAIALANGTVALDLALKAIDVGEGDEVIVSPRTFIASASCVSTAGAVPVFADVDSNSGNINAATIEACVNSRTKAIICVHLAGYPCDMDPIMDLAKSKGIYVIEDCAQAHGALYKNRSVGSIGHIGAWSFCQDKIMTTAGEGGMVTTNDETLWRKMWSYKDHGKSYDAVFNTEHPFGFRWLHESIGTNWRMTEIQGVIGRYQLKKMSEWHSTRLRNLNHIYTAAQKIKGIRVPDITENIEHAAYKCYLQIIPEALKPGWNRDRILLELIERGVPCAQGTCSEVYLEKAFSRQKIFPATRLRIAEELGKTSIMFMVHPTLSAEQIVQTCDVLAAVMSEATVNE